MVNKKTAYDIEYQKNNVKQIKLALNLRKDADILTALEQKDNIAGYIKELIRSDINK